MLVCLDAEGAGLSASHGTEASGVTDCKIKSALKACAGIEVDQAHNKHGSYCAQCVTPHTGALM